MNYKSGIEKVRSGECPRKALSPMGCMFCEFGHMMECHFPMNCEEANCSHYQELTNDMPDDDDFYEYPQEL